MRRVTVREKLRQLGHADTEEGWSGLLAVAKRMALKRRLDGSVYLGHWWRGPLLYALVKRLRPLHVLEIGTGHGYGAVCMASAMADLGLDGTIWTVDVLAPTTKQEWLMDAGQGPGPNRMQKNSGLVQGSRLEVRGKDDVSTLANRASSNLEPRTSNEGVFQQAAKLLSIEEVWQAHVPKAVGERVRFVTGRSDALLRRWTAEGRPAPAFCFIDGGHDYPTVREDLADVCRIASAGVVVLLDDYTRRRGYGVRRLVDGDLAKRLPPEAIELIDLEVRDETVFGERPAHEMALLSGPDLIQAAIAAASSHRVRVAAERAWRGARAGLASAKAAIVGNTAGAGGTQV